MKVYWIDWKIKFGKVSLFSDIEYVATITYYLENANSDYEIYIFINHLATVCKCSWFVCRHIDYIAMKVSRMLSLLWKQVTTEGGTILNLYEDLRKLKKTKTAPKVQCDRIQSVQTYKGLSADIIA